MKQPLIDYLNSEAIIINDGGIATSLYEKGFYINRSFEELSVTDAQAVREVAQGFKRAGANLLSTNTFNALYPKLVQHGLQDSQKEIIESSVAITAEVAGDDSYAIGVIGPLGALIEPLGATSFDEALQAFKQVAQTMEASGVDGFSLAGMHDLKEVEAAIQGVQSVSEKPIIVHLAIQESMKTSYGHTIEEFNTLAEQYNVAALGFSGEVGPSGMLTALQKLRPMTSKLISLMPNAGLPRYVNDEYIYLCNPDYIGKYSKRFVQSGANIIGGFSGVHADHIKAICNNIRMVKSSVTTQDVQVSTHIQPIVDEPQKMKSLKERSKLGKYLEEQKRICSVEIIPPKGVDFSKFHSHCEALVKAGVEFVNIPDGARAVARMSSLQMASHVKHTLDLEPIPHFTSRDRNLLGLQSDLLGCHVNGIRNVLLVTGDPPKLGNCPGATAVYDVDAIGLTHIVSRMNQGLDLGGSSFGKPTEFCIGVALNPTAYNVELEAKRFKYKIEAGADYAITQPIYDVEAYKKFFDSCENCDDLPIIMGIWPLVSLRNAEFLKNEVPGVEVPDWALAEMEKAGDNKEEAVKRGLEIAQRTMEQAKDLVAGFQVSAPFNKVEVALECINSL